MARSDANFATISEIIRAARTRLPADHWDCSAGGVGSETTLRRNRQSMETVAFRPRLLRGVKSPDLNTTLLGHQLSSPLVLAPVGMMALFSENGAVGPARVAAKRGIISCNSIMTSPHLSEVGAAGPGRVMLQLYFRGDRSWLRDTIQQAEASNYVALVVTVDSIGGGTRDRDLLNRFDITTACRHPNLPGGVWLGLEYQVSSTWDDFSWIRSVTKLPVMIKGITTTDDARMAVECGAAAVYVSNHGCRALDSLPAALEVLPEVVDAVSGRAEVIVDSGFLRGTDVIKALAMGARAVSLGRLQIWSLAAGGEAGLDRALEMLQQEIYETLQLLGCPSVAELNPSYLRPSTPTRFATSDWYRYEWAPLPRL